LVEPCSEEGVGVMSPGHLVTMKGSSKVGETVPIATPDKPEALAVSIFCHASVS